MDKTPQFVDVNTPGEMEIVIGALLEGLDPAVVLDTYRQASANGRGFQSDRDGHDMAVTSFKADGETWFSFGPVDHPDHAGFFKLPQAVAIRDHLSKLIAQA